MNHPRPRGFSLVELTLALGVAAVCLTALFGLLPIGVANNRTSISETTATSIATAIISDLRASAAANKVSPLAQTQLFSIPVPFTGTNTVFFGDTGQMSGTANQDASAAANPTPRYRATVIFYPPSGRNATVTRLLITWPALADPTAASAPINYAGSWEIVTALDIN